jgi:formiminotetrahydrofolate cyclodeaminase
MAVVASYNVQIKISRIKDKTFVSKCEKEVTEILKRQEVPFRMWMAAPTFARRDYL